jgi:hypothetical protein
VEIEEIIREAKRRYASSPYMRSVREAAFRDGAEWAAAFYRPTRTEAQVLREASRSPYLRKFYLDTADNLEDYATELEAIVR